MANYLKNSNSNFGNIATRQNIPLTVSFGIPAVDTILGGGLPLGTVSLIEEDINGCYSKIMLKYYLAESIINNNSIFIASQDMSPHNIIKELPAVIKNCDEESSISNTNSDKMTIAFRYQNLPTNMKDDVNKLGHYYDLSKTMSKSDLENKDICYWSGQRIENRPSTFANPAYHELLKSIKNVIKEGKFFLKDNPSKRSILRIGIHSLGSPMWLPHRKTYHLVKATRDLAMFIFCLRALVRSASAVAVITIPTHLYYESSFQRCIHSSDIAMRLQAFSGTELEHSPCLSDYHGFFYLNKLAPMNSFASKHPGSVEYVFKLKRRKFIVEKLHLPPDIQESNDNKKNIPMYGCGGGSNSNKLLDF